MNLTNQQYIIEYSVLCDRMESSPYSDMTLFHLHVFLVNNQVLPVSHQSRIMTYYMSLSISYHPFILEKFYQWLLDVNSLIIDNTPASVIFKVMRMFYWQRRILSETTLCVNFLMYLYKHGEQYKRYLHWLNNEELRIFNEKISHHENIRKKLFQKCSI